MVIKTSKQKVGHEKKRYHFNTLKVKRDVGEWTTEWGWAYMAVFWGGGRGKIKWGIGIKGEYGTGNRSLQKKKKKKGFEGRGPKEMYICCAATSPLTHRMASNKKKHGGGVKGKRNTYKGEVFKKWGMGAPHGVGCHQWGNAGWKIISKSGAKQTKGHGGDQGGGGGCIARGVEEGSKIHMGKKGGGEKKSKMVGKGGCNWGGVGTKRGTL